MKQVRISYHAEPEGWWADSPDLPGWKAAGDSFEETRRQVHDGAEFAAGEEVFIIEVGAPLDLPEHPSPSS